MAENHHGAQFYTRSKIKYPQIIYRWKANLVRINIVLRTKIQKWICFEPLMKKQRNMFLKVVAFLLKIAKI